MKDPYEAISKVPSFILRSNDLIDNTPMPLSQVSGIFGAGGCDISPHLEWADFPSGTESFVISLFDPFAPTGSGFWHWVVVDIPVSVTSLASGVGDNEGKNLPSGAWQMLNDAGLRRYIGAAPPAGHGKHVYYFAVHALNIPKVEVDQNSTPAFLMFNIRLNTLGRSVLTSYWEVENSE